MNLSILDTHRLPYRNAEFTAVALGTTTPVKFHDADGNDLGYKVYTNSGGYICDSHSLERMRSSSVHTTEVK